METPEEEVAALEYADGEEDLLSYFMVYQHCGELETGGDPYKDYLDSLWPCPTAKLLGDICNE